MVTMPPSSERPFHLLRWFAVLAALVIGAIAVANAMLLSRFLNQQLFQREAAVTRDFVQNIVQSDSSLDFLLHPDDPVLRERFRGTALHFDNLRDVLRANVYGRDRRVLWSSNKALVGQVFDDNEELAAALRGELVVEAGSIADEERAKGEHQGLAPQAHFFVETYVPVLDTQGRVAGVVELYKAPLALSQAIQAARWRVGLSALAGALLLFGSLFWLVQRADRQLRKQQALLLQAETLAATGQLAAAVAHNIRNPLASIRSSAELLLDAPPDQVPDGAQDILRDADRISARITELLKLAAPVVAQTTPLDLSTWLAEFARNQQSVLARRQQRLHTDLPAGAAMAQADPQLLEHALQSLLANASEAMPAGGQCLLALQPLSTERYWRIELQDNGSGIAPEALDAVQQAFVTTKPNGLGLGLLLARRIVERLGGRFALASEQGVGTTVRLDIPRLN